MTKGRYVYAVVRHNDDAPLPVRGSGLDGAPVEELWCGDVGVLVSPFGAERARSSRANLTAHERVVEAARAAGTVLPMRFGIVMPSPTAVVNDFLKPNRLGLSLLLAEMAGKVEYRLKVSYLPDVAWREVVSASRVIQRLQAAVRGRPEAATYHARINLGELVAAGLEDLKARDAGRILDRLSHHCVLSDVLPPGAETVALRVALLLDEAKVDDFEREVDRLADDSEGRLRLALVGPLAPWDFVEMGSAAGPDLVDPLPAGSS